MYLSETLAALGRRWLVLILGAMITAVAGLWAADPPPTYQATETFAIQPPRSPEDPNQLTGLRPSLATTGAVVAQRLTTASGQADLRRAGVAGRYTISPRNSGTLQTPEYRIAWVQVTASGPDESSALHSLALVTQAFRQELVRLQDQWDVAWEERISTGELAAPSVYLVPQSKVRALVGVAALGAGLTIAAALWADAFIRRRPIGVRLSRPAWIGTKRA